MPAHPELSDKLVVEDSGAQGAKLYYSDRPEVIVVVPHEQCCFLKKRALGSEDRPLSCENATSIIPTYVLRHLRNRRTEITLYLREDNLGLPGNSYIIETISSSEGAIFLVTPHGQSDLAFPVTGYDAVCFASAKFVLVSVEGPHTQYIAQIPENMLTDMVYNNHFPCHTKKIGDTVRFCRSLQMPSNFSSQVIVCDHCI